MLAFTRGIGFDSVIITAGTSSSAPLQLSMEIARKRANVVIVGAVGMELQRQPWYMKEINLKISCSYGPGRYDSNYEEYGQDYPAGYVRWTENRNMQAFIDLISAGNLDLKAMTSHSFTIEKSPEAYKLISSDEDFLGVVLEYNLDKEQEFKLISNPEAGTEKKDVNMSLIGAGQFAQNYLIPPLKDSKISFESVATSSSVNAKTAAKVNGFRNSTTDAASILNDKDTNFVVIATRHDTHGRYVLEGLKNNKAVYVEKPLAVNREELDEIKASVEEGAWLMTGFNRRFSKPFQKIKSYFNNKTQPMIVSYRVNAGKIPKDHWVQQKNNGGRIIGEVCHFIDTIIYLTGELPIKVNAQSISGTDSEMMNDDNVIITLKLSGGSIATIEYLANGAKNMPKEFCEVFCEGRSAEMDNFNAVRYYDGKSMKLSTFNGKKGINEEIMEVVSRIRNSQDSPISFKELYITTLTTFKILESLEKGVSVEIK